MFRKKILIVLFFTPILIILFTKCNRKQIIQQETAIIIPLTLKDSINVSINKVEKYLETVDYTLDGNNIIYMVTDLLAKHFNRQINIPKFSSLIAQNPIYNGNHWMLYGHYFADRTYKGLIVKKEYQTTRDSVRTMLLENIWNMDYRTFWCMYCNVFPIPDTLLSLLNIYVNTSEYDLTHAALQTQFITENNYCHLDTTKINQLREKSIDRMNEDTRLYFKSKEIADKDLLMELFAILAYMNRYDLLNKDYIRFVLSTQHTDGGWIHKRDESEAHISVLAYWFLLEAEQHLDLFQEHFE